MQKFLGRTGIVAFREYLRTNGLKTNILTDEDFEYISEIIEQKKTLKESICFTKEWIKRQIRESHKPLQTQKYLLYTYKSNFVYIAWVMFYFVSILLLCKNSDYFYMCMIVRFVMSIHLGYQNAKWVGNIFMTIITNLIDIANGIYKIRSVLPLIIFEFMALIFEVFIGKVLFYSMLGMFFMVYGLPLIIPEMSSMSIWMEFYEYMLGDPPLILVILNKII